MLPSLLRTLQARWKARVRVVWTDNSSVYLSVRRAPPRSPSAPPAPAEWVIRLHRSFAGAPLPVWTSLERFLLTGRRAHLAPLREFFRSRSGPRLPRPKPLRAEGRVHDLGALLRELKHSAPFRELPPVEATWGRRVRPGLRTIRLGCYLPARPGEGSSSALVRLHRLLDSAQVPQTVVAQVLHHELVHHYLSCTRGPPAGRRHGRDFRRLEESFPPFGSALEWQRLHLPSLIRAERRRKRAGHGGATP
ncbi:MAG: hypothetical protein HY900_33160 [Deltaproteobacteria bacterium]|nr:hypothetical protein [Deltaproteobacteria bacterium]